MKISRHKKLHKYMSFYINNFGFRPPIQLLIDGTYCLAAKKNKHNIRDNLPRIFQCEIKFLTTQCVIIETENLGKKVSDALIIVKQFAIHKCSHIGKPVPGSVCLKSMVGKNNKNRYVIATQDRELQNHLRTIPGVPLMYLHQKSPVLERPSEISFETAKINKNNSFGMRKIDTEVIDKLKEDTGIATTIIEKKKRKKKKGNPNPLSCKTSKKKKNHVQSNVLNINNESKNIKTRHRKRIKIPEHVKQELLNKVNC